MAIVSERNVGSLPDKLPFVQFPLPIPPIGTQEATLRHAPVHAGDVLAKKFRPGAIQPVMANEDGLGVFGLGHSGLNDVFG